MRLAVSRPLENAQSMLQDCDQVNGFLRYHAA